MSVSASFLLERNIEGSALDKAADGRTLTPEEQKAGNGR
jgi:hypothetical protein